LRCEHFSSSVFCQLRCRCLVSFAGTCSLVYRISRLSDERKPTPRLDYSNLYRGIRIQPAPCSVSPTGVSGKTLHNLITHLSISGFRHRHNITRCIFTILLRRRWWCGELRSDASVCLSVRELISKTKLYQIFSRMWLAKC